MKPIDTTPIAERSLAQEAEQHEVAMRRAKQASRAWYAETPILLNLLRRSPD